MTPFLTIIIPTIGRAGLERTLRSIRQQAMETDVTVVYDSHSALVPDRLYDLTEKYEVDLVYHDGGIHAWGHPQRNYGVEGAVGGWLAWMADDDIYAEGAFEQIQAAIDTLEYPMPLIFRARMHFGETLWKRPVIEAGNIDASMFVVPNDPAKLGTWTNRYTGDVDFISETVAKYSGAVSWRPEVIAITRPTVEQDWTTKSVRVGVRI